MSATQLSFHTKLTQIFGAPDLGSNIDNAARQSDALFMAKTKHRSPNYPRLAFDAALEKMRAIYEQQHKHSASREVIAQALGYTTFNGASQAVITALQH